MFPFFVNFIRISCVSVSQVFALPFLPAEHISAAFDALMAQATTFALVDLMDYIQRNWLRSPVWTTESWSVYNQSVRTNNDVEGWHHRINHRGNGTAPPFYRLVPVVSSSLDIVNLVFTQRNRSAFIEFTFATLHHAMPCTRVAASSIVRHHISMHQVTCGSLQYCCKHSILPPLGIKVNEGLRQILKFKSSNLLILC